MKATILASTLLLGLTVAGTSQSAQAAPMTIADFAAHSVEVSEADAGQSALLHTVNGYKKAHRGDRRGSFRNHRRGGFHGHRSFGNRGFHNRGFKNRRFGHHRSLKRGFGHNSFGHGIHGHSNFDHGGHHRAKKKFGLFGLFFK